jgi:hypothetical protein
MRQQESENRSQQRRQDYESRFFEIELHVEATPLRTKLVGSTLTLSAMPPDVRKGCALPTAPDWIWGFAPALGRSPKLSGTLLGGAKPPPHIGRRSRKPIFRSVLPPSYSLIISHGNPFQKWPGDLRQAINV